jgi:glycosyltransferase involved in cell wall biosynthesis
MLYRLLQHSDQAEFEHQVISMTDIGVVGEKIRALGVPVRALGMRRGVPNPRGVLRLARWLTQDAPDVVQSWMYQADLVGGLAARLARGVPVAWGIHSAYLDPRSVKRIKIWTVQACAWSSRWLPTQIVCCSEASWEVHAELGYPVNKMLTIPNGCDLETFRPDPEARSAVRRELGLQEGTPLVGLVARFDEYGPAAPRERREPALRRYWPKRRLASPKDHHTFIRAAALLRARVPDANFVLCGERITWQNVQLTEWIDAAGIRSHCHLLGRRLDMPRLTAALDVATSSSAYSEAWPLVLGEAMACGVPCAVTDVGDSALIVGDTGRVVPPKDPEALADAWHELLTLRPGVRAQLGLAARRRMEEHFSLTSAVAKYEELYRGLALRSGPAAPLYASSGKGDVERKMLEPAGSREPLDPSSTLRFRLTSTQDAEGVSGEG